MVVKTIQDKSRLIYSPELKGISRVLRYLLRGTASLGEGKSEKDLSSCHWNGGGDGSRRKMSGACGETKFT